MTHPLTLRLLRNRADFYRELLGRIPWEELRREFGLAIGDLPKTEPPDSAAPTSSASSALLQALVLDEWLKKEGVGVRRARCVISIENALAEALRLEQLGILLCDALAEENPDSTSDLKPIRDQHVRAYLALRELNDRLEYHRFTLVGPSNLLNNK
ncbi:MAG: hypothetical protein FJY66_01210 [Calditrichaeota bacterium]|nr:hypothetical protein [Calditrichota bacterium]